MPKCQRLLVLSADWLEILGSDGEILYSISIFIIEVNIIQLFNKITLFPLSNLLNVKNGEKISRNCFNSIKISTVTFEEFSVQSIWYMFTLYLLYNCHAIGIGWTLIPQRLKKYFLNFISLFLFGSPSSMAMS